MSETKLDAGSFRRGRILALVGFAAWVLAVSAGAVWMTRFTSTPGQAGKAPAHWPAASTVALDRTNITLLMFAHPRCPCTSASLSELERLMARADGQVRAYVLFLKPQELGEAWSETELCRRARAIPGVSVKMDPEGAMARRFGCETSGDVVVYGTRGDLLFHGGITISRGHEGDNPGLSAIVALSKSQAGQTKSTPVFGCSIFAKQCPENGHP